ncbi:MAG: methyltransferase [Chloroflexota bacterium]
MRNPMISAVITILLGEALLLGSWTIAALALGFLLLNTVYFVFSEEPGLEKRFGEEYVEYKANVPRWVPRMTPWQPEAQTGEPA